VGAVVIAVACVAGCQTERVVTSDGRPLPPKPRPAPRAPVGTEPTQMLLVPPMKPDDADGNGYPDLLRVEAALFGATHPSPLTADGAFIFTLYRLGTVHDADRTPIREWRFEGDAVQGALTRKVYGICYRFNLSLNAGGLDRMPEMEADLRGRFEPANGGAVVHCSDEVRMVRVGRGPAPAAGTDAASGTN
jgi:hypothetical protein